MTTIEDFEEDWSELQGDEKRAYDLAISDLCGEIRHVLRSYGDHSLREAFRKLLTTYETEH